ncbi:Adenylate kinase [Spirochaeta thermophila DSM 6578]|uniref:Adenylate kinase n=1 Tax=Winmispira thermophila (strain ATCC 700085 / DSM 6578 / Z-1203) TaxID=869211 RepID=G0GC92_WINT7|nr:adenylate kinase [Spirochaeta thermophila]AEJ61177.1 Adenylate kinase [Spirochaeta thermophila DSM 6578]
MRLVFLGPPGAGKGTVAAILKDRLGIPHISTGDLFRDAISRKTDLGREVEGILARGELVPDELTVALVRERLKAPDAGHGYILDGFPRTIPQAEALEAFSPPEKVVNFVIDDEEVVKRLSGRRVCPSTGRVYHVIYNPPKVEGKDDETGEDLVIRPDDRPEAIRHRLEVYRTQTAPLITYYGKKSRLVDIPSDRSIEEVVHLVEQAVRGL